MEIINNERRERQVDLFVLTKRFYYPEYSTVQAHLVKKLVWLFRARHHLGVRTFVWSMTTLRDTILDPIVSRAPTDGQGLILLSDPIPNVSPFEDLTINCS